MASSIWKNCKAKGLPHGRPFKLQCEQCPLTIRDFGPVGIATPLDQPGSLRGCNLQFIVQLANHKQRCHPEWSEAESRDLRTNFTKNVNEVRRFLDSPAARSK